MALRARATVGAALMTSPDQTGRMGYDTFGLTSRFHFGYAFAPFMSLQLGFGATSYPGIGGNTGAAMAPTVGTLLTLPGDLLQPFIYGDFGLAFTGPISRPYLDAGLGLDVRISRAFTVGPLFGYGHILQKDGPRYSSDARSIELCATVTFRPVSDPPAERRVIYVHERVTETISMPPPSDPSPELDALLDQALPVKTSRIELLAPVLFKLGSDELEAIGIAMLHEVARELNKRPDIHLVEIEGYTDSRGSDELNEELSQRRAQHVLDWLVEHGVAAERLRTAAHGASEPVEQSAETEEAHEQNRRVVFRVIEAEEP